MSCVLSVQHFEYFGVCCQGFIEGGGGGGNHLAPPTYQETVPITNILTARIHLWKNSRCF